MRARVALNRHDWAGDARGAVAGGLHDGRGERAGSVHTGRRYDSGDERLLRGLYDLKYLFGDKWVPAILVLLLNGPMRRKEILSTLSSYPIGKEWSDKHTVLHDSYLARVLKKMTEEGLLTRTHDTETFPPRVYYSLKPEVVEFLELTRRTMLTWVDAHPDVIARAQEYARRNGDELEASTKKDLGLSDEDDD